MEKTDLIHVPGEWNIKYNYTAGEATSRFLLELKNNKRIMGKRCDRCARVFVPPRMFCETCFTPTGDWVELGNTGEIESFTFGPRKLSAGTDEPFAIAYVRLNGADTCICNYVKGIDLKDMKKELFIGKKVQVEFKKQKKGLITDFYFTPVK